MKKLLKTITIPLLFTAITFILLISFYPFSFNKPYQLFLVDHRQYQSLYEFHDMDGDGEAELLHTGYNHPEYQSFPFVRILRKLTGTEQMLEQINLKNPRLPLKATARAGDYDNDQLKEYYVFTIKDSVLYLEGFEYRSNHSEIQPFIYKEIVEVHRHQGKYDFYVFAENELIDLNRDGYKELVFIVNGMFGAEPRGIFAYDIKNDSLWRTPEWNFSISKIYSITHHEKTCFSAYTLTPSNVDPPLSKYHDHCGWAFLLDENLEFVFEPVAGKAGYDYMVRTFPFIRNDRVHALSFFHAPPGSGDTSEIKVYDDAGVLIMQKKIEMSGRLFFHDLPPEEGIVIFGVQNSSVAWLCNVTASIELKKLSSREAGIMTRTQFLLPSEKTGLGITIGMNIKDGTMELFSRKLRPFAGLKVPDRSGLFNTTFGVTQGRKYMAHSNYFSTAFFEIIASPGYAFRWLYRTGILMLLMAFFWAMQWVFTYQLKKQQHIRETLVQSQLALSKRQLEPHFLLNTLNNIGYMFTHTDKTQAQYYFGKYASLLRRGLNLADKTETSLEEELAFINDYLVLQKKRFEGNLDYLIESEPGIRLSHVFIPHSLIYTFAENAVKHGLLSKEGGGMLVIRVTGTNKGVVVTITDNGIGRAKAGKLNTAGTGKGLAIVDTIIEGYNKLYNRQISYRVNDVKNDDGSVGGTEVRVML